MKGLKMRSLILCLLALFALPMTAHAQAGGKPIPGFVRVRLNTSAGVIVVALDARHAPKTTANFLAYVDDGRLDDTSFYRAARRKGGPQLGFVQGGIGTDPRRMLQPVPLEPTSATGIHHLDGTLSMAHGADPNSGTANFSILVGANPALDAHGSSRGYTAFGHVVAGMDVVRRILAMPTGGGGGEMKGEMILQPVRLISAQRLDGTAHPSGLPKTWLFGVRR
jgi:peptidyl-prolyl cis-trans isomerase A (cyclophilin A)